MSAIAVYLASLTDDAEEVDLSTFVHIEDLNDATWTKLKSNETMKRLKLPPSLRTIRDRAFQNSQLTHVTFPSSLRSIGNWAFSNCIKLTIHDLKLPDSLEDLGYGTFYGCRGLTGKLYTQITGNSSFARCTGLTQLDLDHCKEIEEGCFAFCTELTALKFSSALQRIEELAFYNCTGLAGPLIIPPSVSFIHPTALKGCSGMTKQSIEEEYFVGFES
jgi:hypothetical protein